MSQDFFCLETINVLFTGIFLSVKQKVCLQTPILPTRGQSSPLAHHEFIQLLSFHSMQRPFNACSRHDFPFIDQWLIAS